MNRIIAAVVVLAVAFFAGAWFGHRNLELARDSAVADALRNESKRNDEVVNGWNHAVLALRARLRNGDAPKIPVSGPAGTPPPACGTAGTATDGVSIARELAACRDERQRLIEDGAQTMITCRALQEWAK